MSCFLNLLLFVKALLSKGARTDVQIVWLGSVLPRHDTAEHLMYGAHMHTNTVTVRMKCRHL